MYVQAKVNSTFFFPIAPLCFKFCLVRIHFELSPVKASRIGASYKNSNERTTDGAEARKSWKSQAGREGCCVILQSTVPALESEPECAQKVR